SFNITITCTNPTGSPTVKWERPGPGKLKLNMDAACFGNTTFIGVGGIIRDCNGLVRAAFFRKLSGTHTLWWQSF
ncbi:hypothetical protein PanWU01x14_169130, partial [Parasponia andersonii]